MEILYADNFPEYFTKFNRLMARTDLLWTKPSELSFYCGLGIRWLSPPDWPHEVYNQQWLMEIGAAIRNKTRNTAATGFLNFWKKAVSP